jgi:hypothetical protein
MRDGAVAVIVALIGAVAIEGGYIAYKVKEIGAEMPYLVPDDSAGRTLDQIASKLDCTNERLESIDDRLWGLAPGTSGRSSCLGQ